MSRAAIFIDAAYVDFMLREEFGSVRIDYGKLSLAVAPAGKELLRTYYYCCGPYLSNPPTPDERTRQAKFDAFTASLKSLPRYEIRQGQLAFRGLDQAGKPRFEQKRVDILLAVDLVRLASKAQITEAVLLMGDSDFLPAIQSAKDEGVLIKVFHGCAPHRALLQAADENYQLDQAFIEKLRRI